MHVTGMLDYTMCSFDAKKVQKIIVVSKLSCNNIDTFLADSLRSAVAGAVAVSARA